MEQSNRQEMEIDTPQFIPQQSIHNRSKSSQILNAMAETVADIEPGAV